MISEIGYLLLRSRRMTKNKILLKRNNSPSLVQCLSFTGMNIEHSSICNDILSQVLLLERGNIKTHLFVHPSLLVTKTC